MSSLPTTPASRSTAAAASSSVGWAGLRGATAMSFVGGSAAVSGLVAGDGAATAQAIRYTLAALILVLVARGMGVTIRRPRGGEWLWLAGVSMSGLFLFNIAMLIGSRHAEPAALGVAIAAVPIVLAVIGPLTQGMPVSRHLVVAAAVVTAGAVMVQGFGSTDAIGMLCAVALLITEAGFTLLAVPVLAAHGPFGISVHTTWMAAVVFAVTAVVREGPGAAVRIDARQWAAVAFLTIAATAVAFVLWYSCVAAIGPARAGLLSGVVPVAAAIGGVLLGRDLPGPMVWVGVAIVAAGLLIGFRGPRRSPAQSKRPVASGAHR